MTRPISIKKRDAFGFHLHAICRWLAIASDSITVDDSANSVKLVCLSGLVKVSSRVACFACLFEFLDSVGLRCLVETIQG